MAMAAFTGMDGAGAIWGAGGVCQASGAAARGGCGNAPGGACSGIIGKFGIGEPPMNGEHPAGGQPPALRAGVRASQQTVPITGMRAQGAAVRMRGILSGCRERWGKKTWSRIRGGPLFRSRGGFLPPQRSRAAAGQRRADARAET